MKSPFFTVCFALVFGCGGAVELGPIEEEEATDPGIDHEFSPAFVDFTTWNRGMCALFSDESIHCWSFEETSAKRAPLTGIAFAAIDNTEGRICAVQRSGRVVCVDDNCYEGEAGGCWFTKEPFEVPGIESAVSISLEACGGVALRSDGSLQSWVDEARASGCWANGLPPDLLGEPLYFHAPVVQMSESGGGVVTADGRAFSVNLAPQNKTLAPRIEPTAYEPVWPPLLVAGIDDAVMIAAGDDTNAVLHRSGRITTFGWAAELGTGSAAQGVDVGEAVGIDDAVVIETSGAGTCAIRSDGSLWCWGFAMSGELGVVGPADEYHQYTHWLYAPARVETVVGVRAVGMRVHMTCVVEGTNAVSCWGWGGPDIGRSVAPRRIHFR